MNVYSDDGLVSAAVSVISANDALLFTESTNRVNISNNAVLNTLTALTLECFFKPSGTPTLAGRLLDKQGVASKGYNIIFNTAMHIQTTVGNATTQAGPTGAITLVAGTWYHVAMTWDGSNVKLWIDGVNDGTSALVGGNTGDDLLAFNIGNRPAFDRGLSGTVQEVRLSNIARYTAGFTRPAAKFTTDANTIALWHIDEGSGTTAADSSVNGLTGTLGGTLPTWTPGLL